MTTENKESLQMGICTMRKLKRIFLLPALVSAALFVGVAEGPQSGIAHANYLKISKTSIGQSQTIRVGLNKSMVVDLPGDAHDILVANPDVADAITRTSRRIYIFGKQVGSTNLFIFDSSGAQLLNINLEVERDITGLEENLKRFVPGSDVKVEVVSDNIILTGTVPTPQASARVVQLARAFITGGEATTGQFNQNAVSTSAGGDTFVFGQEERQQSQIVNLLRIDGEDQVHLKVTIAEIQRTIVKQLGIDITAAGITVGQIAAGFATDNPFSLANPLTGSSAGLNYNNSGGESIDAVLRAIDHAGLLRTLAEPSLTAISGETASFAVGGEYNIPDGKSESTEEVNGVPQSVVTFNSRQISYGVSLSFTPVVLGPGRISLRIRTEVSEPTTEGVFFIPRGAAAASPSPGVRRRQAETTVELPSGGSMVLAGLLKDDVRQTAAGFPGLSKVPVLGALFRSREFQRFETELVIIATPYLVRPVARNRLARPDDNFQPTSDGAANFLGRLNRVYGKVEGKLPEGKYHGQVGFIFK